MNTRPYHIAVFSGERPGLGEVERVVGIRRAINTLQDAGGFTIRRCLGVYGGQEEAGVFVTFTDPDKLRLVLHVANTLEQECILHVDANDQAELIFGNNVHRALGTWRESLTRPDGDHTQVDGRYFVA